jgi:hypothetical protein
MFDLNQNGALAAWGENEYGQLGNGEPTGPEFCGVLTCARGGLPVANVSEAISVAAGVGSPLR